MTKAQQKDVVRNIGGAIRWTYTLVGAYLLCEGWHMSNLYMLAIGGMIFFSGIMCMDELIEGAVSVIDDPDAPGLTPSRPRRYVVEEEKPTGTDNLEGYTSEPK